MSENPNKLNLDHLLDLKRAEKPGDDFWEGFQTEFRQRQLQTLIEKESKWKHTARLLFARSSLLVPLSGLAVALFVLTLNFQQEEPSFDGYLEGADLLQADSESSSAEVAIDVTQELPVVEESQVIPVDTIPEAASFVMDLIHNEEPEPPRLHSRISNFNDLCRKKSCGGIGVLHHRSR